MTKKNNTSDKMEVTSHQNKINVLQIIRNNQTITRAEIIQQSKLSAPTVTRIVENLAQKKLIKTNGVGSSIGGRRPQLISFQSKDNYVIGIDIGGTFIRSALSNLDGEFIIEIQLPTNIKQGFAGVMQQVGELIEKLSLRAKQKSLTLWGIGIAVCGMVNKNTQIIEYSPIFNWQNVDIKKALSKFTQLNIVLGNVTHLIAMGELLYGTGKKYKNFICMNLGYGIGSGIIIDGKLFTGADGIAGEVGHIVVDKYSKIKGLEGVNGTLEALASGYGIADIAKERTKQTPSSSLYNLANNDIDAKTVFTHANNGDELASAIIKEITQYYGIAIDTLIKLFNTECIILSGGLVENNPILLDKITTEIKKYSMSGISKKVPILQANFSENAALMGSFSLILEKILLLEQQA